MHRTINRAQSEFRTTERKGKAEKKTYFKSNVTLFDPLKKSNMHIRKNLRDK